MYYFELFMNPKGAIESKKSYRTTFKLTTEAIEGLKWLQKTHKITLKEIFDHVVEKIKSYYDEVAQENTIPEGSFDLEDIIKKMKKHPRQLNDYPRKTYVLSLGSLLFLKDTSLEYDVSRDDMISKIIENITDKEKARRKINKEKYIEASKILSKFEAHAKGVYEQLERILSDGSDEGLGMQLEGLRINTVDTGIIPLQETLAELIKETGSGNKKINSIPKGA